MNKTIKQSLTVSVFLANMLYAQEVLEPITVTTVNKTTQNIEETTSSVTVISAEEIEERGYHTVAEAINSAAGISVAQSGGLGQQSSFFLRGADSGKVLVLLDGMRLNDPSTTDGKALLETLTTANIEQIEIVKGGMNSIWGSNASAGVINIITKEPKKGTHGSLSLLYGSENTQGMDADIAYQDNKLSVQLLASYLDTDGISALAPREAEADGYTNKNINAKLGYNIDEKNKLTFTLNRNQSDTAYDVGDPNDTVSMIASKQNNMAFGYTYLGDSYSMALSASKGSFEREATDLYGGLNIYDSDITEYSWINTVHYQNGKAVAGVEYKEIEGDNQYVSPYYSSIAKADYKSKSAFVSNLYTFLGNTLLETNLRYDDFDQFENKTTFKAGVKHQFESLAGLVTGTNAYTSYDAPSAYQFANTLFGTVLKPAYTTGFDLYLSYNDLLSVTYFDNRVEDSIDFDSINYGYFNIDGKSRFKGMEVESRYRLEVISLDLSANYTHLFEATKEDGTDLYRRPEDTVNFTANYVTELSTYGVTMAYVGDRTDIKYNPDYTTSEISTGNYTVWNFNYSRELNEDMKLTINAKNIFDKDYQSVYGYAVEGRSVYAKVTYSF